MRVSTVVPTAGGGRVLLDPGGDDVSGVDLRVTGTDRIERPATSSVDSLDATGAIWRRVWSLPDRLVVEFVDVATAEVRDHDRSLAFDRSLPDPLTRHLVLDHVLPLARARRGELVVHAGLLHRAGCAAVLIGRSGAGKSTLVAFCGQHGWTVGGDDGVVLHPGDPWAAEPTYAGLRLGTESLALLGQNPSNAFDSAGKWDLTIDGTCLRQIKPAPIGALLLVEPTAEPAGADVSELHGVEAHAAVFQAVFQPNRADVRAMESIIRRVAELIESVPVGRLCVPRGQAGLAAAEGSLRRFLKDRS